MDKITLVDSPGVLRVIWDKKTGDYTVHVKSADVRIVREKTYEKCLEEVSALGLECMCYFWTCPNCKHKNSSGDVDDPGTCLSCGKEFKLKEK